MKNIMISVSNTLLSEAIKKSLDETGNFRTELIKPDRINQTLVDIKTLTPDIILLEVSYINKFNKNDRLKLTEEIKNINKNIKIVMLCDENIDEFVDFVKKLKMKNTIDSFFYTSVTTKYLTSMLESL